MHTQSAMKKTILSLFALSAISIAMASTYQVTLASNSAKVTPGMRVTGSTGWYEGYQRVTVNGVVTRVFFGTQTYTWDRTNTSSDTYMGYTVVTAAVDQEPDSGLVSHFYTPATVLWGPVAVPVPVDPPGPAGQ